LSYLNSAPDRRRKRRRKDSLLAVIGKSMLALPALCNAVS
jgi:hypothetical protein